MEFSALLSAVYDETNYATSPASAVVTRIKRFVNEGVRLILSEPGLARLADSDNPYTFASVASQARYVVPEAVARILTITERTNDLPLLVMDRARYRHVEPDPTSTGTPTHYVPVGRTAVAVQPSDASSLFVKSDSASDTTQVAYIEGIITGGYMRTASVTLTGTTAVNLTSAISTFIEITDFYLSAVGVGTITLHEDSGAGTELARITIGQKRPRYYAFLLWPTPAAVVTYYVDYRRRVVDMVNDTDEPSISEDVHPMLVAHGVRREAEKTGNPTLAAMATARYETFLKNLKYETQTLGDELPVMGGGRRVGHSRLGSMYPADSYRG